MITAKTRLDRASFNDALREAVASRNQWAKPIVLWMYQEGTTIGFEARANTVPPGDGCDERFLELSDDTLSNLAEVLDDQSAFDAMVTEILTDGINRYGSD